MNIGDTVTAPATSIGSWLKQPFSSGMGAGGWFLFFGLLIAISVAWGVILKDLKGEL